MIPKPSNCSIQVWDLLNKTYDVKKAQNSWADQLCIDVWTESETFIVFGCPIKDHGNLKSIQDEKLCIFDYKAQPKINIICDRDGLQYGDTLFSTYPIRNKGLLNIWTFLSEAAYPEDGFMLLEPITVQPQHYVLENLKRFSKVYTWFTGFDEVLPIKRIKAYYQFEKYPEIAGLTPWDERRDEYVIIAHPNKTSNHPASIYNERLEIAENFHNKGKAVSWYGSGRLNKPYFKGPAVSKYDVLKDVKYHICFENTHHPLYSKGYLTEKLYHSMLFGTSPIYKGYSGYLSGIRSRGSKETTGS